MTGNLKAIRPFLLIVLLLTLAGSSPGANAVAQEEVTCTPIEGETVTLAAAKLYIEYNATDGDLGVHGYFDGDGYAELCVYDPNGALVLAIKPQGQLKDLTVGTIFFESREPSSEEFTYDDLVARFPAGQYEVRGLTFDGKNLTGAATFTHNVPAAPTITLPALAEDEEAAGEAPVPAGGLVVAWDPVTATFNGGPVVITGYEVIITKTTDADPHGFSNPAFDVHVPPDRTTLTVSPEFLEPNTVYELEVLALEESGNQTITVGYIKTEG